MNDGSVPQLPTTGAKRRKKALDRRRGVGQPQSVLAKGQKRKRAAPKEDPLDVPTTKKDFDARVLARDLITDPEYQEKLRARLLEGSLGNLEIWLWRYAGGDPKPDDAEMEAQKKRFEELRGRLQLLLKESPDKARALEAGVLGKKKALPLPRQLEVTVLPPDGSEPPGS